MPIFVGRTEELNTFKNSFEVISKENGLLSFKKPEKQKVPQIFLFDGEGGFGKTTLTNQCVQIAKDISKKQVKVVKVDFHNYFLQKNTLENNSRKLISALYTHLVKDENLELQKYFTKYKELQEKVEKIEEKVKEDKKEEGIYDNLANLASEGASDFLDSYLPGAGTLSKGITKQATKKTLEYGESAIKNAWEKKLPKDELDLYKNSDKMLSERLAEGLIEASQKHPILLVIDTFEEIDNQDIDAWLFTSFLKAIYESEKNNRLIFIISGRKNHFKDYKEANSDRDLLYHKTLTSFGVEEVKELASKFNLSLTDEQYKKIHKYTSGIPLVLEDAFQYILDYKPNINSFIEEIKSNQGNASGIFSGMVKRFLRYCKDDEVTLKYVYYLALTLDLDTEVLAKVWECTTDEVEKIIKALFEKHSFINTEGMLHSVVKEYLRKHLLTDKLSQNKIKTYNQKLAQTYEIQLQACEAKWNYEERYENEIYHKTIIKYFNALLWYDQEEAFNWFSVRLLEFLEFNVFIVFPLLSIRVKDKEDKFIVLKYGIGELRGVMSNKYKKWEDYQEAFKDYFPIYVFKQERKGHYLREKNLQSLKSYLEYLTKNIIKYKLNEFQQQLLKYKWAEWAFWTLQKEKAVQLLEECQDYFDLEKLNSQIGFYYKNIGYIYEADKTFSKAETFYHKAIEKEEWGAYGNLGTLYQNHFKDYPKAEAFCQKVIEKEVWMAYINLGYLYQKHFKDYPKAEAYYQQAIKKEEWLAHNNLGTLYQEHFKNYPKAEEFYRKAIEIELWMAYINLGNLYQQHFKDYPKAEAYYQKAIEKEVWGAYGNLGTLYQEHFKNYPKAEAFYQKAIEKEEWEAYRNLGTLYKKHFKDYSKAEEFYQKALEKEVWWAYSNLANLYLIDNKIEKAGITTQEGIQKINQLLIKDPKNEGYYAILAALYAVLDNKENFYQYLQTAIEYDYEMDDDKENYPDAVLKYFDEERFQALLKQSRLPKK